MAFLGLNICPLLLLSTPIFPLFSLVPLSATLCFVHVPLNQGFLGRPLRGRFSTVLLRRYLTMMLCTVDFGMRSSCPIDPSDLPSFHRSTTRWRWRTSCSLVFRPREASVKAQRWQTVDTGGAGASSSSSKITHEKIISGQWKTWDLSEMFKTNYKDSRIFISSKYYSQFSFSVHGHSNPEWSVCLWEITKLCMNPPRGLTSRK